MVARRYLRRPRLDGRELQHPGTPSAGPGRGHLSAEARLLGPAFAYGILPCAGLRAGLGALEVTGYPAPRTASRDLHCFQPNKLRAAVGFSQTLTPAGRLDLHALAPVALTLRVRFMGPLGPWLRIRFLFIACSSSVHHINFYATLTCDLVTHYHPLIPSDQSL